MGTIKTHVVKWVYSPSSSCGNSSNPIWEVSHNITLSLGHNGKGKRLEFLLKILLMHFIHREDVFHKRKRCELKRFINWFGFMFQVWTEDFFGSSVRWERHLSALRVTRRSDPAWFISLNTHNSLMVFLLPAWLCVREMGSKVKFYRMRYCHISSLWQGHFSRDEDGLTGRKGEQELKARLSHISQFLHLYTQPEGLIFPAVRGGLCCRFLSRPRQLCVSSWLLFWGCFSMPGTPHGKEQIFLYCIQTLP